MNSIDDLSGVILDRVKCVAWVGEMLLETQPLGDQGVAESDFLSDWKDQLPEEWRKYATLSALRV